MHDFQPLGGEETVMSNSSKGRTLTAVRAPWCGSRGADSM